MPYSFQDTFDTYNNINDTTSSKNWYLQQLQSGTLSLEHQKVYSGDTSIHARAIGDNPQTDLGKADLIKNVSISAGETVHASAYFYFPSGQSLDRIFIMDIESKSALEGTGVPNLLTGVRLYLKGSEGYLAFNRGKMGDYGDANSNIAMPRDQWVKIDWHMKLGIGDAGQTDVYVNDQKALSVTGTNWPDQAMAPRYGWDYNDTFVYDRFKVGITANNGPNTANVYFDDVQLKSGSGIDPVSNPGPEAPPVPMSSN